MKPRQNLAVSEKSWPRLSFFPLALAGLVIAGALALNVSGPTYDARSASIIEASQLIAKAREAAGQENWLKVREYASQALVLNPTHVLGRLLLGLSLLNMNALDEAEAEFRQVLKIAGQDRNSEAWAHNNLGVVFRRRGQFRTALREYETALALDPFNYQAKANLADVIRYLQ